MNVELDKESSDPSIIMDHIKYKKYLYIHTVIHFFENYGWYVLLSSIALLCWYLKFIKPLIFRLKSRYDDAIYAAKYHKNPDLIESRLKAQEKRIEQLQKQFNRDANQFKEKQEQKKQKKYEELLQNVDVGHTLGSSNNSNHSTLRPEYNPLMGAGSSSSYRAPKRSACTRGGCG